jgi:hypothetical protein
MGCGPGDSLGTTEEVSPRLMILLVCSHQAGDSVLSLEARGLPYSIRQRDVGEADSQLGSDPLWWTKSPPSLLSTIGSSSEDAQRALKGLSGTQ